jgi:hypothetical protein
MASVSIFAYSWLICCPWVMQPLAAFGRFLTKSHISLELLLPAALSVLSFPLAYFTGRALITYGSRLVRSRQSELASVMTVTGSIVWLCWAAISCLLPEAGTRLLTQVTTLVVVVNCLIGVRAMNTAKNKLNG